MRSRPRSRLVVVAIEILLASFALDAILPAPMRMCSAGFASQKHTKQVLFIDLRRERSLGSKNGPVVRLPVQCNLSVGDEIYFVQDAAEGLGVPHLQISSASKTVELMHFRDCTSAMAKIESGIQTKTAGGAKIVFDWVAANRRSTVSKSMELVIAEKESQQKNEIVEKTRSITEIEEAARICGEATIAIARFRKIRHQHRNVLSAAEKVVGDLQNLLPSARKIFGEQSEELAYFYDELATMHLAMNKLTAAKNYLQQEIDILQHCKGYHAQGKLREAYESLADAHARIGDAKRSDEALAKAVGVAEQANSGSIDKGYLAEELVRIAKTHFDSASKDIKSRNLRVRTLLVRAIALMKPLAPDHSEECASALLALASVDLNLGDREAVAKDINEAIILTIARFEKWPGGLKCTVLLPRLCSICTITLETIRDISSGTAILISAELILSNAMVPRIQV